MEETPIGEVPREPLSPGNLREPGLRRAAVRAAVSSGHTEQTFFFYLFLKKMVFPKLEQDFRKMMREIEAIYWRLRECIQVRELAATHRQV